MVKKVNRMYFLQSSPKKIKKVQEKIDFRNLKRKTKLYQRKNL